MNEGALWESSIKVGSTGSAKSCNFSHEQLMNDVTHVATVDLFTFSHGGNWNKQGGHVTSMWLVVLFKCYFDALM